MTSRQNFNNMAITTFADIPAVTDKDTHGKRIYHKVFLLREEDVDYSQLPEITGRSCGAFVLKSDAVGWKSFSYVRNTIEDTSESSKGDITSIVTNTFVGTLGGARAVINDFLENHQGDNFFIVYVDIYDKKRYLLGRPYSPMQLTSFSRKNGKDSASCDVTFTNEAFFQPVEYAGTLPSIDEDDGDI